MNVMTTTLVQLILVILTPTPVCTLISIVAMITNVRMTSVLKENVKTITNSATTIILVPMTIAMKKMVSVKLQQKIVPIMIYVLLIIVHQLVIVDILTFLVMTTTHVL
jgi:hypothetical protein